MNYSLWIPVRNEEANIRQVIESSLEQSNPPNHIYVCINGSTDWSSKIVTDMARSIDNLVPLSSNPGKANAWNTIVQESESEILVFCDGDIRFGSWDTLSSLTQILAWSDDLLLGASVIQLPSSRTMPYKLRAPSGQLYALKKTLLEKLKMYWSQMPEEIINDDLFLTLIAYPHVSVTDEVFFYCNKPNISDTFHTQLRILRWIRQVMDMGLSWKLDAMIASSLWGETDWKKKLKYRLIPILAQLVKPWKSDTLWKEATSTKHIVSL